MNRPPSKKSWLERRRFHSPDGLEFYNYPSPTAEKYWLYPLCLGKARMASGYHYAPPNREGFLFHYVHRGVVWHR